MAEVRETFRLDPGNELARQIADRPGRSAGNLFFVGPAHPAARAHQVPHRLLLHEEFLVDQLTRGVPDHLAPLVVARIGVDGNSTTRERAPQL